MPPRASKALPSKGKPIKAQQLGLRDFRAAKTQMEVSDNKETPKPTEKKKLIISRPNMRILMARVMGASMVPYVQHRFTEKAKRQMAEAMMNPKKRRGPGNKDAPLREPRDFDADFEGATYRMADGSFGIPCTQFRKAMVTAHKLVDQKMTIGKLCLFIVADGVDKRDGTPLVKLHGDRTRREPMPVRNDNGSTDLRDRPFFLDWWADVKVRFDADRYSEEDVVNLLLRVGWQVGMGEGRPDSPHSCGMDWGMFDLLDEEGKRVGEIEAA